MPRGKPNAPVYASEKQNTKWDGFVRCDMTASDKEEFLIWVEDNGWAQVFEELVGEAETNDFKLSLMFNKKEGTWMCSYTGTENTPKQYGKFTLTGWGGLPERAMQSLWFKHTVMLKRNWTKGFASSEPKSRDYVG